MIQCKKNLFDSMMGIASRVVFLTLLVGIFSLLFLGSCDRIWSNSSTPKPLLLAEPNPVPAGDLDQPLAATQITWNTGDQTTGDLYFKENRSPEVFLARGPSGTVRVGWIQFDSTYEFRLYAKKRSRLLAKLDVTRDN
jgi:hypothetical protein